MYLCIPNVQQLQVNEWTAAPSMTIRRSCVGITELDGIMYALGGYDGYTCLDYMERYDPYMEVGIVYLVCEQMIFVIIDIILLYSF